MIVNLWSCPVSMTREGILHRYTEGRICHLGYVVFFSFMVFPGEDPGVHTPIKYATNLSLLQPGRSMFFSMMVVSRGLLL